MYTDGDWTSDHKSQIEQYKWNAQGAVAMQELTET